MEDTDCNKLTDKKEYFGFLFRLFKYTYLISVLNKQVANNRSVLLEQIAKPE